MPYQINAAEVDRIAAGLAEYYDDARNAGLKERVAQMGRSQMGLVTGYLDAAQDTWANFRKKSSDSFRVTFKSDLKAAVAVYFANKFDVAADFVTLGEKLLDKLVSLIPFPKLASAVQGGVSFAADKAKDELYDRSVTEADKPLMNRSDSELSTIFSHDKDTTPFVTNAMKQYKALTSLISTMPMNITSFDDAITYPKSAFKVQRAASSLNVSLWAIGQYVLAMQERLVECQKVSEEIIVTVRTKMPEAVRTVLKNSYDEAMNKGKLDITGKKYAAPAAPKVLPPKAGAGGATLLAGAMAHAIALGYYEAGNSGPVLTSPLPKAPPQLRR